MMSTRDKRALTIAGMAAALFLLLAFGVFPMWDRWQAERANLAVRERTLLKYRDAVATRALRKTEGSTLEARLRDAEAGLLTGETPAIASAELRELIQQLAAEHAIEVRSSQFLPVKPLGDDYWQVPLGLQLQGRMDSLVSFLKAGGASSKLLSVTQLSIVTSANKEKLLTVNLTVAAILRREAASSGRQQ